jgi:ATP-dependent helicase IRC3
MLRDYQDGTLNAVVTAFDAGINRQLAALATGAGKTVIFSNLPERLETRLPGQMWVIAHREELIDQAVTKIRQWNPSLIVDKEMAEHYANPAADVIVSCIASIGRKGTARANRFDWEDVTKVVIDEAHHTNAQTYLNFLELTGFMVPGKDKKGRDTLVPNNDCRKLLLGVTATPKRGDGQALGDVYQKIVYNYPIRKAIEDGWLVDLRAFRVQTTTSLDDVQTTSGDFQQDQLADAVNNPTRNQLVVKSWLELGEDRPTLGFTVDIKHAQDLAAMFRQEGVTAQAVWGSDPDRAEKLQAHKDKVFKVLLNCGVLIEGYDDWRIGCVIDAAPTKSSSRYTQKIGRGTRLQDGTGNLLEALANGVQLEKTDCIVIDVCDATRKHRLQSVPSLLGLDTDIDLKGQPAVKAINELEKAQAANPNIDFSKLKDITQLKTYIESVNIWDGGEVAEEIKTNSQFQWRKRVDGSFMLMLQSEASETEFFHRGGRVMPVYKQKTLYIKENALGKYEIVSMLRTTASDKCAASTVVQSTAQIDTLADAFRAADGAVVRAGKAEHLTRTTVVKTYPASNPQRKAVAGYYKRTLSVLPFCACPINPGTKTCVKCGKENSMTSTQASNLIQEAQAKRRG